MPDDGVKLGPLGRVSKHALTIGGLGAGALMVFLLLRNRGTAPATPDATDLADGSDGLELDSAGDAFAPGAGAGTGITPGTVIPGVGLHSNAEWAARVRDDLGGVVDPAALSSALGAYLTGAPVQRGSAVEDLIHQAISAEGYPPVAGPANHPPAINESTPAGQKPPPKPAPKPGPAPKPKPAPKTYTVRSGDTLSSIAARFHVTHAALYNRNATVIEKAARAHGLSSSASGGHEKGHWIYAGTRLSIP